MMLSILLAERICQKVRKGEDIEELFLMPTAIFLDIIILSIIFGGK